MSDDFAIPAPKLPPHRSLNKKPCPACGLHPRRWGRFLDWLQGKDAASYWRTIWCDGNKPLNMPNDQSAIFICAGIAEAHLHSTCGRCNHQIIMATKEPTHAYHRI